LFLIQVVQHDFYVALAEGRNQILNKLVPKRGEIYAFDKNGSEVPLAIGRQYPSVYAVPKEIEDPEYAAEILAQILGMEKDPILEKLKLKGDPYEPLKTRLEEDVAERIKSANLKGIYLDSEELRWYPQKFLACHSLGFLGFKKSQRAGQYGVEEFYEEELAGKIGLIKAQKDALGRWVMAGDYYEIESAQDGADIFLTLDPNIQFMAEQKLKALLEKWGSPSGSLIVMEPKTGAIKAISSFPDFDPNAYQNAGDIDVFLNPVIQKAFEPGSVFKPITIAAGLDAAKITPESTYFDTGSIQIGGYTIKNAAERSYGLSSMTQVLEKSINTGVVFAERKTGDEIFKKYIDAFGFGRQTGIDLAGEASGNISNLKSGREINFATASFGQGIAVTPLQMASAISAIANGGKLMKPYLVDKIVYADGQEKKTEPAVIRQVISGQTAAKLTAMLVSTVRNGYDKIKIKKYFVAGKTGTAQIPSPDGGYSEETIHSFVGYAPAYDPKFLIFIKMDTPTGITFASDSLSPVFSDMAQYLLNYYEVPPEE
jgi:cell division protein FtsI/penicillin-binding protein 2